MPELAAVETRDNGSLLRSMRNSVMPRVARNFRFFADQLLALETGVKDYDGFAERVAWDPSGVTVVITPWNAPLMLATWRVAPALAAGNAVILKPPEWAPLTASMLADIAHEAGLPDGAFNVVQGIGEEAGAALTAHPGVDRIAFTGSDPDRQARRAGSAAANLTPVSLELGGKSPFVAFADADLDAVVQQAVNQFDNAGQVCLAGTRLIVERSMHDEFLERFVEAAGSDRAGRPARGDHRHRPADHPRALRARRRLRAAREGRRRHGGLRRRARTRTSAACTTGRPCSPTRRAGRRSSRRRSSAPCSRCRPSTSEDEAVALANSTEYGLAAIVYTGDQARAERVSSALVAGTVWVNCFFVRDLAAPFGGARGSGIGREGGPWSFDFYADVKNVCTAPWN